MVKMNEDTKKRIRRVISTGQTLFQWGFIPVIVYLGFKQGPDPQTPEFGLLRDHSKQLKKLRPDTDEFV
ncbi:Mitochondrial import receptor subunit TOM7-like protein [Trichoplax sp. H2]|nr:Mitochondrial import receptor subunit TOM7-like protein [Trichoplax sp. H2]|eukprot:RDD38761.1 Mitochondrial import receptor subunit TOM7-like protein [Trichoplax sp. H2]